MTPDKPLIVEHGLLSISNTAWEQARRRSAMIGPLAAMDTVGHSAVDDAAGQLGLSRRQVYALVNRYRQGAGAVTDVAAGQSDGGHGGGDFRSRSNC